MRILLAEDDEVLTGVLVESLQQQRYVVDTVEDGCFAVEYAETGSYDLLLIDVGLPRLDGISLCQQLRNAGCKVPILLMTAKNAPNERIRGLDAGADDYLTKPLDMAELHARLRALLRRGDVATSTVLEVGQLQLNPVSCEVSYADCPLKLTPKEYSLLEMFLRNPTRVFSRSQIVEHLWTFDDPPLEDSVKAHIKGLRKRLKTAGADGWIENVYGLGYKLSPKIDYEAIAAKKATSSGELSAAVSSQVPLKSAAKAASEDLGLEDSALERSVEAQFQQSMAALWQQHRALMDKRLALLQQATSALKQNKLTGELQQAASQAAHKLAGVLGMFGTDEGTRLARALETALANDDKNALTYVALSPLLEALETVFKETDKFLTRFGQADEAIVSTPTSSLPVASQSIQPSSTATTILAVDDDSVFLSALSPLLEPWGFSIVLLSDPTKFWEVLIETQPDLLILDIEMPQVSGLKLCQAMRSDSQDNGRWQSLPVLFLTARNDAAGDVFAAGADDYIVKPVLGPELITRISNRLERSRLLKALSSRDTQTGLVNQIQSQQDLQQLSDRGEGYTFLLIQLTNLAEINLAYGHTAGHQVLQAWGNEIRAQVLTLPARIVASYWGNGEFVIGLAMDTERDTKDAIAPLLQTFRQRIFTALLAVQSDTNASAQSGRFQSQYALGFAHYPTQGKSVERLYQVAYGAMQKVSQ